MNVIKVAILVLILSTLLLASCNMVRHNHFNAYENKPFDSTRTRIEINGVYFIADYSKSHDTPVLFFLYSDGSVKSSFGSNMSEVSEHRFWTNPEEYVKKLRMNAIGDPGHFWIRERNIFIQIFDINPGAVFPINSLEFRGRVVNDSTFILSKTFCSWCKTSRIAGYDQEYRFYQTEIRPDSSTIWFKKKKWYRDKVWNKDGKGVFK